jgi:hypothetical protein
MTERIPEDARFLSQQDASGTRSSRTSGGKDAVFKKLCLGKPGGESVRGVWIGPDIARKFPSALHDWPMLQAFAEHQSAANIAAKISTKACHSTKAIRLRPI